MTIIPLNANRSVQQHKRACELLGGLIQTPVRQLHSVLDIGCGQGFWALDVARYYPYIKILGIDQNIQHLDQARARAEREKLSNVSFHCMDITQPLNLPEGPFDLVFARYVFLHLSCSDWQVIVQELAKHVSPGGYLQLIDGGLEKATTPAWKELLLIFSHMLQATGKDSQVALSFVPLLVRAHFKLYNCAYHPLLTGCWSEENFAPRDALTRFAKARSLAKETGYVTLEYYDDLLKRAKNEMAWPEFLAAGAVISAIGQKLLI